MPERPEQETPLLPFPEAGKQVLCRQGTGRMLPGIMILVKMLRNNIVQRNEDTDNGSGMDNKTVAGQLYPALTAAAILKLAAGSIEIAEGTEQRPDKGKND